MSLSKVQYLLHNTFVKQNLAEEFVNNLNFERKHPLYNDWTEWKEVVSKFYSWETSMFQRVLFSRTTSDQTHEFNFTPSEKVVHDAIVINDDTHFWKRYKKAQLKTILSEILYSRRRFYPGNFDTTPTPTSNSLNCECIPHYFGEWSTHYVEMNGEELFPEYPYDGCPYQREHILNIYISLIVHLSRHCARSLRKYYRRLARVLYVLPTRFLVDIDINAENGLGDLIFEPKKHQIMGRNLLRQIYERGFFDKLTSHGLKELPFWFESVKHLRNPMQQSDTNQSVSATLFDELAELVSKFPTQQAFDFNVKHDLKVSDAQFAKFEETVAKTHENFMSSLKNTIITSAKEAMMMFLFTACVAMLGYTVMKYGIKIIVKTLNLLYQVTTGIGFREEHRIQQQDGKISIPFLPAMVVNSIISPPAEILQKIWSNPQTDKIMRRIGYLGDPKMSKGVNKITDWLSNIITSVIKWYKEVILGIAYEEDIDKECSPVKKWYEDCDTFFTQYYEGNMQWNDINWSILMNLYGRGMALTRQTVFNEFKQDVWKIVYKLGNLLEKFNSKGRVGTSVRNPPVTIYLAGGTGVGKSSITYPLAAEILKGIFQQEKSTLDLAKYWKNLIYMRSPEQEFWDGYENQLVTVFDDFGQLVDSTSSPNLELFEIIRAANSFPYPLHMASLDQKANTTFNSKIIMVSSNLEQPKTASLNFETALFRRFDISIIVTRKPGVVTKPGVFDPSIYLFQQYDMVTQKLGDFISYKDLIYAATTKYFQRKGFVDSMDDYITTVLQEKEEPKPSTSNPEQQGIGKTLGSSLCYVKDSVKGGWNNVKENYSDFRFSLNGNYAQKAIFEIKYALQDLHLKLIPVQSAWEKFKKDHSYIYKAMKFAGICGLIFGIIKLYISFTSSEKKEKLMSPEQFIKSHKSDPTCDTITKLLHKKGFEAKSIEWVVPKYRDSWVLAGSPQFYDIVDDQVVPRTTQEGYNPANLKNPKVEIFRVCSHELSRIEKIKNFFRIDNTSCEQCRGQIEEQDRIVGPVNESYCTPQIKNARAEFSLLKEKVCEHELGERFWTNPFKRYWLGKSTTCPQCNPNPTAEGVKDLNAAEMAMKIIRTNYYKIFTVDTDEAIGHAMFLRARIVMCPRHYVSAFRRIQGMGGSNKIYFKNVFLDRAFELDVSEILKSAYYLESPEEYNVPILSRDIMAFPVKTATFHSNIEPFYVDKSNMSFVKSTDVMMPVLVNNNIANSNRSIVMFRHTQGHSSLAVKESTIIDNEMGQPARLMRNLWEYSLDTQPAECGAPIIVKNVNISPGKIVGMHVAGHDTNGLGYATPIYKEDINKILSQFPQYDTVEFRVKQNLGEYPSQQCQVPEDAEFIRLGTIERPVAQPVKSKIIPSPLYNKIADVKTRPCALKPVEIEGKIFDPRQYRLGRLGNIPKFIEQLNIDMAVEALVDEISQNISHYDFGPNIKPVYTFEEAVVGIDGEEFINSIKRNTSPGYPFVHLKGFETRKLIFGDDEKCDVNRTQCKILQQRVQSIIEECKIGKISEHIFMDTLKDERKPHHKFHKTRLFSAGPLDYLIACKMYFNGIVAVLQKARNVCGISVGTNVYSSDWSQIARKILSKSNNIVAGDFEGFDASQNVQLLQAAGMVLIQLSKRFCGSSDEDSFVMWCLMITLFNSVHVTGNEVYRWTHSLPSGHYLTAIINSIFVQISFCSIWQIYKGKASYINARSFFKQCGLVAYGDDHILSVPSSESGFNQQTLVDLFKQIGLSYTMEDKDAVATDKFRPMEQISYLKRKFVFNKERQLWLAPIDMDTILESPMWLHKCPDPINQVKAQIDGSLRELSLHSEHIWNKWFPIFEKCSKEIGHFSEYVKHEEVRSIVLE